MDLAHRRLVVGFWLTLVGLVLATVIAGYVFPTPMAPACNTDVCNSAYVSDLIGLGLIIVGMASLAAGVFRPSAPAGGGPQGVPAYPSGPYSFTAAAPAPPLPPSTAPPTVPSVPSPGVRHCPGCGATVTAEYGFCPRCGRTLTQ